MAVVAVVVTLDFDITLDSDRDDVYGELLTSSNISTNSSITADGLLDGDEGLTMFPSLTLILVRGRAPLLAFPVLGTGEMTVGAAGHCEAFRGSTSSHYRHHGS